MPKVATFGLDSSAYGPILRSLAHVGFIPLLLAFTAQPAQGQPANMIWEGEHMLDLGPPVLQWMTGNGSTNGFGPGLPGWAGPRSHWAGRPILGIDPDSMLPGVVETQGPQPGDSMTFDGTWIDVNHNGRADPGMHTISVADHTGMGPVVMGIFATFSGGSIDSNVSIGVGNQSDLLGRRGPVGDFLPTAINGTRLQAPFISVGTTSSTIDLDSVLLEATREIDLNGLNHLLNPRAGGQLPEINLVDSLVNVLPAPGGAGILGIGPSGSEWELNLTRSILHADKILIGPTSGELTLHLTGDAESSISSPLVQIAPATGAIARVNLHHVRGPHFTPDTVVHIGERGKAYLTIENDTLFNSATTFAGLFESSSAEITVDDSYWETRDMFLGFGGAVTVTADHASLLKSNYVVIGQSASQHMAHVTLEGGSAWNASGYLRVGWSGPGRLDVSGASAVDVTEEIVLGVEKGSAGMAEIGGSESRLKTQTTFEVGRYGRGTLDIREGGLAQSVGHFFIGSYEGGVGGVTVDGEGSKLEQLMGNLFVGFGGEGGLSIVGDGSVAANSVVLGAEDGSRGEATLETGGTWTIQRDLIVGQQGQGAISLTDDAELEVQGMAITLGEKSTGFGQISLQGTDAVLRATSASMTIGKEGIGQLQITEGASYHTAGSDILGDEEGSMGFVIVDGEASSWKVNGSPQIGREGEGVLNIYDGAEATAVTAFLGVESAGHGTVTVSGENARWALSDALIVGHKGVGTFTLQEGGRVQTDQQGVVAALDDSTGTVEVTGEDSRWTIGNDLIVGQRGEGTLTIKDGGTINVSGRMAIGLHEGSSGKLVLDGEDVHITTSDNLLLSGEGEGSVELKNGARLTLREVLIGQTQTPDVQGRLDVEGSGSMLESTGPFVVGDGSKGLVRITDGGSVQTQGEVILGREQGSEAEVTILSDDEQASWTIHGDFTAGEKGIVRLNLQNNAMIHVNGTATFGSGSQGEAVLFVDGPQASYAVAGQLRIGATGIGEVTVQQGGALQATTAVISSTSPIGQPQRHARLVVQGGETVFSTEHSLLVGTGPVQRGVLEVLDHGAVETGGEATIGRDPNSMGEITLDDESTWTIDGPLTIGRAGWGEVTLLAGTSTELSTAADVRLATLRGSRGVLRLNPQGGAAPHFSHLGSMFIGESGEGSLIVLGDGQVTTSKSAVIGNSQSQALIRGGGAWQIGDTLQIAGTLQVDGGSTVAVSGEGGVAVSGPSSRISIADAGSSVRGPLIRILSGANVALANGGALFAGHALHVQQGGELHLGSGLANVGHGASLLAGTLSVGPGGTLSGNGTIVGSLRVAGGIDQFTGQLTGGRVTPGQSPGTLTIEGGLVVEPGGVLEMEVGGLVGGQEHDVLNVLGTADIDGLIEIHFVDGFAPRQGDQFPLLAAATLDFTGQVEVQNLAAGFQYDLSFSQGAWMLSALTDGVFIGPSLPGDYNASGQVEQADLDLVLLNWGQTPLDPRALGWLRNLPRGAVDQGELDDVLLHWGSTVRPPVGAGVPEPAAWLLTAIALTSLARRQRVLCPR